MPREEASTFQFILFSIWKPGDSNIWVKICLALEESIFQVEWLIVNPLTILIIKCYAYQTTKVIIFSQKGIFTEFQTNNNS